MFAVILTGGYDLPEAYGPFTKEQAEDWVLSLTLERGSYSVIVPLTKPAGFDFLQGEVT